MNMKRALKKLRGRSGESIGETLVALLISALALVMLAAAITSATGIIRRSNEAIEQHYNDSRPEGDWATQAATKIQ